MVQNATGGPTIVYGQNPTVGGTNYVNEYNNQAAPSQFYAGTGLLDPRFGYQVKANDPMTLGFQGSTNIPTLLVTPSTASTSIIAAAQTPVANTALTLATQSTTGLTVLSAALTVYPSMNVIPVNALAIDGVPGQVTFRSGYTPTGGNVGGVQLYDPTKALSRTLRIQTNLADTAGSFFVSGNDIYGYAMTESIAGSTISTGTILLGRKAFKFIQSITPRGTIGSTSISVGTADTIGLPIRADGFGDLCDVTVGNTSVTLSTGFTASSTVTATSSTGDVRGTYALQTASNGVNIVQIFQTPRTSNIGSITGLFGPTQA